MKTDTIVLTYRDSADPEDVRVYRVCRKVAADELRSLRKHGAYVEWRETGYYYIEDIR